ncbi:hypothetical protein P692DRAFT_20829861 [Suillus brevipes Sb2]|nr:hypothetical protein P692DRAFT_20829861 [Suillus brevipes Sb2]
MNPHFKAPSRPFMRRLRNDGHYRGADLVVWLPDSCDLLMPGVGEIVAGMEVLLAAYKREGIDPASYYWFTDQHKHGG